MKCARSWLRSSIAWQLHINKQSILDISCCCTNSHSYCQPVGADGCSAQWPDINWLQHWSVGCNRSCDVCPSGESIGCPSSCSVQYPFVTTNGYSLVRMANKQGKITAFITRKVDDSLWRRDDSVWRFRLRGRCIVSLYLCAQATGYIARLQAAVEIGSPAICPKTDFYVRRNIARCPLSNSKGFG